MTRLGEAAGLLLSALVLVGCAASTPPTPIIIYVTPAPSADGPTPTPTPKPTPTPTEKPWHPPGWETATRFGVTFANRWLTDTIKCDYSGSKCMGILIVPKNGCAGGMYVELTFEDSAGTVVDYSNDTAGSVRPGQQAEFKFHSFDDRAKTGRISDVSCH